MMICLFGLLMVACGSEEALEPTSPPVSSGPQDVIDNQARWNAAAIDDYDFIYQRICFCPPPFTTPVLIEVRNGAVRSVAYQDSETHLDAPDTTTYPTIPALFDVLTEADERNAVKITVSFSTELGFPEDVYIDYAANIADEEMAFTVTEFVRK